MSAGNAPESPRPPRLDGEAIAAKRQLADVLTALTAGRVRITFEPGLTNPGDPESRGRIFTGFVTIPADQAGEDLDIALDDRRGDLARQLADELYRIVAIYIRLAAKVRTAIRDAQAGENAAGDGDAAEDNIPTGDVDPSDVAAVLGYSSVDVTRKHLAADLIRRHLDRGAKGGAA